MDVVFDYSKLRGRIVEKFGSIASFARTLGISEVTLSRKLNNRVAISRQDMIDLYTPLDI